MEKKEFCGEYLAPKVKVVEMQIRQQMLSGSPFDSQSNGYNEGNYVW